MLFVHGGGFPKGDKAADGRANGAVGRMAAQRGWLGGGHNHYSLAMHLGTSDRRLADEIAGLVADIAGRFFHNGTARMATLRF
ncbi:MAG: hypothetical protein ABI673_09865 [Novosphingobium sp.]